MLPEPEPHLLICTNLYNIRTQASVFSMIVVSTVSIRWQGCNTQQQLAMHKFTDLIYSHAQGAEVDVVRSPSKTNVLGAEAFGLQVC